MISRLAMIGLVVPLVALVAAAVAGCTAKPQIHGMGDPGPAKESQCAATHRVDNLALDRPPPEARELCSGHVSGTPVHIVWTSWALRSSPPDVVAHYARQYAVSPCPGDDSHLELADDHGSRLSVYPAAELDKRPSCTNAARADEGTILLHAHASGLQR
jgi:hypothetical protein